MLSVKKELDPFSAQLKRLYWLDYVNTDGNCSKAEVDIFPVNSNIVVNYSRLKTLLNNKNPPQIGQVQNSLESCMDKQTVEFQTQVSLTLKTLVCLFVVINLTFLSFFLTLYFFIPPGTQVAGIKSVISLKEKVCKIMNKTYGRCFRYLSLKNINITALCTSLVLIDTNSDMALINL